MRERRHPGTRRSCVRAGRDDGRGSASNGRGPARTPPRLGYLRFRTPHDELTRHPGTTLFVGGRYIAQHSSVYLPVYQNDVINVNAIVY